MSEPAVKQHGAIERIVRQDRLVIMAAIAVLGLAGLTSCPLQGRRGAVRDDDMAIRAARIVAQGSWTASGTPRTFDRARACCAGAA